MKANTRRIL